MLLLGLSVTKMPEAALACSCYKPTSAKEALEHADVVFAGTVIETKQERLQEGRRGAIEYREANWFNVERVWKGELDKQRIVYDEGDEASCGYAFEQGASYLVYAVVDEAGEAYASFCGGTVSLSDAGADLTALGSGQFPTNHNDLEAVMAKISNEDHDLQLLMAYFAAMVIIVVFLVVSIRKQARRY